jgi:cytochrome c biogenesis protein ResB
MARKTLKIAWRFLTRLKVAAVLIVILLLAAALGSCFPQLPLADTDAEELVRWDASVRARYGTLTDLLSAIKVFDWFRSPLFLTPLGLLAVATLVCTLDRWQVTWRRAFYTPVRPSVTIFRAAPHTAKLVTPSPSNAIIRERLRGRGFRVRSVTAEDVLYLRGDRNRLAWLATLVTHLGVLLLLLGTILSSRFGWREELTIATDGAAQIEHASQLKLRNEGFTIERYPDGSVSNYRAQVAVLEGDREVVRGSIKVNEPLVHGSLGLHLLGYGDARTDYSVTLLVVQDPGYSVVISAGFLLFMGLAMSLNFPRSWIQARVDPDGTLRLAGWAERQAAEFEREFAALVGELGRLARAGREGSG